MTGAIEGSREAGADTEISENENKGILPLGQCKLKKIKNISAGKVHKMIFDIGPTPYHKLVTISVQT